MVKVAAIIVAAGRGTRAGDGPPKQYRILAGEAVLARSLRPFLDHDEVEAVQVVTGAHDRPAYEAALRSLGAIASRKLRPEVIGGASRQESVWAGLSALSSLGPEIVLVHDGARPFVSAGLISRAITAGEAGGAAVPVLPVTDTVKQVADGLVTGTLDRSALRAVQTPQAFRTHVLQGAYAKLGAAVAFATDDASLVEQAGGTVHVFEGEADNVKLTHPDDFALAERRLGNALVPRTGFGFDVHTFGPGDHVWLGGVRVAHDRGVVAHSDGDVVLHALTDALLGAIADGDIGTHFPPSDASWRGASSDQFLAFAAQRLRERGGVIDHLDVMILSEAPRIGPLRQAMRERIAEIAGLAVDQVSIKATTTEGLGFVGRREGLAAQAVASVRLLTRSEHHG
ncbi:MAG TPA: bifunctional 2-C-methyl-D-erythritol 4-phosphate cytidylyltransferase/2-C-methyl-D-erythritol 2,4-cyclodiphosphate synthase [Beijerinckiaceae bacterium]